MTAVGVWTVGAAIVWIAALGAARGPAPDDEVRTAPAKLSETGLYEHGRAPAIDPRNRPFAPQYPLWTDAAGKSRWVYLPPGAVIDTTDPHDWRVPVGARFWKEFRFGGRKVETRLIWRASETQWVFASYRWNEAQTEADLVPPEGWREAAEVAPGRWHDIPGTADCAACHGTTRPGPLGFNALQLSDDRDPEAIHGERLESGMLTIASLDAAGLLSPRRPELVASPPRIQTRQPEARRLLGYFAANCGTCHNRRGEIGPDAPSLHFSDLLGDADEVLRRLARHRTMWQIPGQPEGAAVMLDRAAPERSAMLVRMRSRRPSSQMPPLGTVLRDEAAIRAIETWMAAGNSAAFPSVTRRKR